MSNVTPPAGPGFDKLTVNVKVVAPLLPSGNDTSLMLIVGGALQSLVGEIELRGGVPALSVGVVKSAELLSVSVHPSDFLSADFVALSAAVGAVSEQFAVP